MKKNTFKLKMLNVEIVEDSILLLSYDQTNKVLFTKLDDYKHYTDETQFWRILWNQLGKL